MQLQKKRRFRCKTYSRGIKIYRNHTLTDPVAVALDSSPIAIEFVPVAEAFPLT